MSPHTLDYIPPEPRRRIGYRAVAWGLGGIALLVVIGNAASLPIKEVNVGLDPVTGSEIRTTTWPFGISTGPRVTPSPLETKLAARGIPYAPSWRFFSSTGQTIFGTPRSFSCGSQPPVANLRPVIAEFAAAATDGELREFVRVMQTGTDAQQLVAVEAAGQKGLDAKYPPTTGP